MNWRQVCALAKQLPDVAEGIWFRTPALVVRGKSFVRLKEDGATVVFLTETVDEQEALCDAMPAIYFITDHYRGWPAVLARLSTLTPRECRVRLERAWRTKAPKTVVRAFDGEAMDKSGEKLRTRSAGKPLRKSSTRSARKSGRRSEAKSVAK